MAATGCEDGGIVQGTRGLGGCEGKPNLGPNFDVKAHNGFFFFMTRRTELVNQRFNSFISMV